MGTDKDNEGVYDVGIYVTLNELTGQTRINHGYNSRIKINTLDDLSKLLLAVDKSHQRFLEELQNGRLS